MSQIASNSESLDCSRILVRQIHATPRMSDVLAALERQKRIGPASLDVAVYRILENGLDVANLRIRPCRILKLEKDQKREGRAFPSLHCRGGRN